MRKAFAPLFVSILVIGLTSCSGSRNAQNSPLPAWALDRPVSSVHYIGIGSALPQATPGDALKLAKERAAADLAAEISVTVQSSSFLETEERNGIIQQEFSSAISSRTEERIVGFEVVDTHEDERGAFVYFRLNKARHAADREARRQSAIGVAKEEWVSGQADLQNGDVSKALEHWNAAIMALEEFWTDVNRVDIEGTLLSLEPHLVRQMREALRNVNVSPVVPSVQLNAQGNFAFPLGVRCTISNETAKGIPLAYRYHNGTYLKKATEFTDDSGQIVALIEGVASERPDDQFRCRIDVDRLMKSAHVHPVVMELIGPIQASEIQVPIEVQLPSVVIVKGPGTEPLNGADVPFKEALSGAFAALGYPVMGGGGDDAELIVTYELRAERRAPSGDLSQFHTTYLEGNISITSPTGRVLVSLPLERVKGVQLTTEASLLQALSKAKDELNKITVPALIQRLH